MSSQRTAKGVLWGRFHGAGVGNRTCYIMWAIVHIIFGIDITELLFPVWKTRRGGSGRAGGRVFSTAFIG